MLIARARPAPFEPNRRGVILLAILGFILLFSILTIQFLQSVTLQVRRQAQVAASDDLALVSLSALEAMLAVLEEKRTLDQGLFGAGQGWQAAFKEAGLQWPEGLSVRVKIEDLGSKLPINQVPERQLQALFEQMEIDFSDQEVMIDSLVDWIDDDGPRYKLNGAEADWYKRKGFKQLPANRPLTSLESLAHVRGWRTVFFDEDTGEPGPLFKQLSDAVTVYNAGALNWNSLNGPLLEALTRDSDTTAQLLLDALAGEDREMGTGDDVFFRDEADLLEAGLDPSLVKLAETQMTLFMVHVHVQQPGASQTLEALVQARGNQKNKGKPDPEDPERKSGSQQGASGAKKTDQVSYPFEILQLRTR